MNLNQIAETPKVSRQIVYRIRDNSQQVENTWLRGNGGKLRAGAKLPLR
jgi:hypothetical protein